MLSRNLLFLALATLCVSACQESDIAQTKVKLKGNDGGDDPPTLRLTSASSILQVGASTALTASGGVPPYNWTLSPSVGQLMVGSTPSTATFISPSVAAELDISVSDSVSTKVSVHLSVQGNDPDDPPIVLSPQQVSLAASATQTFVASGGSGTGYVFSMVSGPGSINASSGLFTAPAASGVSVLKVVDSKNHEATSTVTTTKAPDPWAGLPGCSEDAKRRYYQVLMTPGVNLSEWMAQGPTETYSLSDLRARIGDTDLNNLKNAGFKHVRLNVEPFFLAEAYKTGGDSSVFNPDKLAYLHQQIQKLLDRGIGVVLDVHPSKKNFENKSLKTVVARGGVHLTNYAKFWSTLAREMAAKYDPEKVLLEVMNEPTFNDAAKLKTTMEAVVAAIRSVAPRFTVVVSSDGYSEVSKLLAETSPIADCNTIYTVHNYDSTIFTHQTFTFAWAPLQYLKNVPYPSTPANVAPLLGSVTDATAKSALKAYGDAKWNYAKLKSAADVLKTWSVNRNRLVWVGEFGAGKHAATSARAAWLRDMVTAMNANSLAWTAWDYSGSTDNFHLYKKDSSGKRIAIPELLQALGL